MSETGTKRKALPVALGMHVCQSIITDAQTGMYSLINMFDQIITQSFPCEHASKVFVLLSNGHGRATGFMQLVDLEASAALASVPVIFQFNDPLIPLRLTVDMPLRLPHSGRYSLELYLEGSMIASRILTAAFPRF